jgi:NAD(P)-dependent dehydrogenase (short-subunit alcohol dehydrogenase family)
MGVLVAGGTGALGQAVVTELLDSGYGCAVTWVVEHERRRAEEEFGDRAVLIHADLLDPAGAAEAVAEVDGLEAVVNLVGGFSMGGLVHETDPADFARMLELNLTPAFNLARAGMPRMMDNGEGAFVGVSAQSVLKPFAGAAGYITAKAAVLAFIRALDAEYKSHGIRCNAILPSVIDTPANREAMPDADHSKWVQPAAIAKVVRFLVSSDSSPTTGAAIPV